MTKGKWLAALASGFGVVLVTIGLYIVLTPDGPQWVVRTSWMNSQSEGQVRVCGGGDVGIQAVNGYNTLPHSQATYVDLPSNTDVAHDEFLKSVKNGSMNCDVLWLDIIYTKEFAAKRLLYDMTAYLELDNRQADFNDRMLKTTKYDRREWGVPITLDVGTFYYRGDRVPRPRSWRDVFNRSRPRPPNPRPGLRVQISRYEGLTVLLLELAYAAGAEPIVSEDGKSAQLDQSAVGKALRFMRDAARDHVIPRLEQLDTSNVRVYELGRASYLRAWPYFGAQIRKDAREKGQSASARATRLQVAANTEIVPLPPWDTHGRSVGVLGGHVLAIPRSAPHPAAALRLIDYATHEEQVRKNVNRNWAYPVLKDMAREPGLPNQRVVAAIDATKVVERPSLVNYADVSTVISCRVGQIILHPPPGDLRDRLSSMNREVQAVLQGKPPKVTGSSCTSPPS